MTNTRDPYYIPADTSDEIDGYVISTPEGERLYTATVYSLALAILDCQPGVACFDEPGLTDVWLVTLMRGQGLNYTEFMHRIAADPRI